MLQSFLENYDFCKYVNFGAISWKNWYFTKIASLEFESKNPSVHMWHM